MKERKEPSLPSKESSRVRGQHMEFQKKFDKMEQKGGHCGWKTTGSEEDEMSVGIQAG